MNEREKKGNFLFFYNYFIYLQTVKKYKKQRIVSTNTIFLLLKKRVWLSQPVAGFLSIGLVKLYPFLFITKEKIVVFFFLSQKKKLWYF